jgi:hypothetical protein
MIDTPLEDLFGAALVVALPLLLAAGVCRRLDSPVAILERAAAGAAALAIVLGVALHPADVALAVAIAGLVFATAGLALLAGAAIELAFDRASRLRVRMSRSRPRRASRSVRPAAQARA